MKTPMQEVYENFNKMSDRDFKAWMLNTDLLEKEKALLIKTHGNKKVYDSQIDPTIVTGEEWYNKTFNTKEND